MNRILRHRIAHQCYPDPSDDGSADYDTAERKLNQTEKLVDSRILIFKSPFRAGVKIISAQNNFAYHRYPDPSDDGSAYYDTAERKLNQTEKLVDSRITLFKSPFRAGVK